MLTWCVTHWSSVSRARASHCVTSTHSQRWVSGCHTDIRWQGHVCPLCKGRSAVRTQRRGDRKRQDDIFNYVVWENSLKFQKMPFLLTWDAGLAIGKKSEQLRTEEVYIPLLILTCLNIKQGTFRRWPTHRNLPRILWCKQRNSHIQGNVGNWSRQSDLYCSPRIKWV